MLYVCGNNHLRKVAERWWMYWDSLRGRSWNSIMARSSSRREHLVFASSCRATELMQLLQGGLAIGFSDCRAHLSLFERAAIGAWMHSAAR
jgi:hypothetical protein